MKLHSYIKKTHSLLLGCVAIFSAVACGSYEYAGSDQDGIYASEPKVRAEQQPIISENERTVQKKETESNDSGYYANYFEQESNKIEKAQEIMFTDVEAYSSNRTDSTGVERDDYADGEQISYLTGDPSWGSNPSEINVNYYNSGFYNPYYYDYGYGWGYPSYGISFYWGWHSPYGWFYNPYYYNPYYYAYNPYYYNPYYYNPYYSYSPYYGRRTAYHPTYRNGYRSSDYDRNAARSQSRNVRSSARSGNPDRDVRATQNDRNNRSSVERIRNPRNINAGTRSRTRSYNDRSVRTQREVNSRTRTTAPTRRTRSNNTSTRTRSSSRNNSSSTNVRTRTYSSPSTPTRSMRSNPSSGSRGRR